MKTNMGSVDRILRVVVAAAVAFLFFTGRVDGITATVLVILAGVFVLTGLVGSCPLYSIFGLSTCKTDAKA